MPTSPTRPSTRLGSLAAVILLAALGWSSPASAQELQTPRSRQGYFIGLGLLGAAAHNNDDGDKSNVYGMANSLRLGQMITATLGLGLAIDVGSGKSGNDQTLLVGIGFEGQWEVVTNLALRAGVGLGVVEIDDVSRSDDSLRGVYATAYTLGVGYDWFFTHPRTGGWSVTPVAQVRLVPGDNFTSWSGFFGVEICRWTGLPKNQLDLSTSDAFR